MYQPVPNLESDIHGDQWVARLREEHAMHGYDSHGHDRIPTTHTPDNDGWLDVMATRWIEMTRGGRAITAKLAHRVADFRTPDRYQTVIAEGSPDPIPVTIAQLAGKLGPEMVDKVWAYHLDPSTGTGSPADRRRSWYWSTRLDPEPEPKVSLVQAEAMLDWPIYRQAILDEVFGDLWSQASESEEKVLATLAQCAGIKPRLGR